MARFYKIIILLFLLFFQNILVGYNYKQNSIVLDAEINDTLERFVRPIFRVAHIDQDLLQIFLIINPDINAFATFKSQIFVHSGLIAKSTSVGQVISVLAHETAHIANKDIFKTIGAMTKSKNIALATTAIALAALLSPAPQAGMGLLAAGNAIAEKTFYKYSRKQESIADNTGISFLEKLGWPLEGMSAFMKIMGEANSLSLHNPYLLTHPLTKSRIKNTTSTIKSYIDYKGTFPSNFPKIYNTLKAKIIALQTPISQSLPLKKIIGKENKLYAKCLFIYRQQKLNEALLSINSLIKHDPSNPYYYQVLGLILADQRDINSSLQAFEKALLLSNNNLIIGIEYAQIIISTKQSKLIDKALHILYKAIEIYPDIITLWRLLALAYAEKNEPGPMHFYFAEFFYRQNKLSLAKKYVIKSLKTLNKDKKSTLYQKAEDLLLAIKKDNIKT